MRPCGGLISRNERRAPKALDVQEFLDWEEHQELRYEFDGFEPVAMYGGTDAHEAIGGTLRAILRDRLRGTPCRVRGPTMKIEVLGYVILEQESIGAIVFARHGADWIARALTENLRPSYAVA